MLLGDIQVSSYPGRIIVTEPKGFVQPRINVEKHSLRHVVLNGQTTLPCIAQGHPVPTYRWVWSVKEKKLYERMNDSNRSIYDKQKSKFHDRIFEDFSCSHSSDSNFNMNL